MAIRQEDHPFKDNLEDIRRRLMAGPTKDELVAMQLHLGVLEKWDGLMMRAKDEHHHHHMDDHDDVT